MIELRCAVLVLGGGPAGYTAAIRAGELGLDTVLVEAGELGPGLLVSRRRQARRQPQAECQDNGPTMHVSHPILLSGSGCCAAPP